MNKLLAAAAVAATMVSGSAISAQAATQQFFFGPITEKGSFTVPAFTFTSEYRVTGITFGDSTGKIKFGPLSISGTSFTDNANKSPFYFNSDLNVLVGKGDALTISGVAPSAGSGFNGNITVSTVPLPTSVALFGTAVLGLGVVGAVRRKGKAAVSATA